jgi:hypothetical protein
MKRVLYTAHSQVLQSYYSGVRRRDSEPAGDVERVKVSKADQIKHVHDSETRTVQRHGSETRIVQRHGSETRILRQLPTANNSP